MPQTTTPPQDNTARAVLVIVLAVLGLALGDALIKLSSGSVSIWQMFVMRSVLAVPVLLVLAAVFARRAFGRLRAPGWTALRSLLLVIMWLLYYASLPHVDLSVAAAAYYTSPLFITLFAAIGTGERITRRGWLAVAIGMVGVLLIIRPSSQAFNAFALLPLLSAMLYAAAMILTRTRCRAEHPLMLSIALNAGFVLVGIGALIVLPAGAGWPTGFDPRWVVMDGAAWITMTILATAILIGSLGAAYAYQNGPPATVGTFDFSYVGFSVLWGWLIFAERPDALAALGIALIIAAGLLSLRRQTISDQKAPAN